MGRNMKAKQKFIYVIMLFYYFIIMALISFKFMYMCAFCRKICIKI